MVVGVQLCKYTGILLFKYTKKFKTIELCTSSSKFMEYKLNLNKTISFKGIKLYGEKNLLGHQSPAVTVTSSHAPRCSRHRDSAQTISSTWDALAADLLGILYS